MPLLTDSDKQQYLVKRGWKMRDVRHGWKWNKPPLVAFYQLGDAFDLQVAIEGEQYRAKKKKPKV